VCAYEYIILCGQRMVKKVKEEVNLICLKGWV
jgi:hypothetical protein